MEKCFSGVEFVATWDARRPSGFVRTAIVDSAIAVRLAAAQKLDAGNGVMPTAATNGLWKTGSMIATGNVLLGDAMRQLA